MDTIGILKIKVKRLTSYINDIIWNVFITFMQGHGCEVWDTENNSVVAALAFHPTDQVLVIAAGNTVYFWDWTKPEPFAKCSTSHDYERIRYVCKLSC